MNVNNFTLPTHTPHTPNSTHSIIDHFDQRLWLSSTLVFNSVTPRVSGILPSSWEIENEETPDAEQPHYSLPYTMVKFTLQFKNIIDLVRYHRNNQ